MEIFSDTNFLSSAGGDLLLTHPFPPHSTGSLTSLFTGNADFDLTEDVKPSLGILPEISSSLPDLFPPSTEMFTDFLLPPPIPSFSASASQLVSEKLKLTNTTNHTAPNSALGYNNISQLLINPLRLLPPVNHLFNYNLSSSINTTTMFHLPNLCYPEDCYHPPPSIDVFVQSRKLPRLAVADSPVPPPPPSPITPSLTLDSILSGFDLSKFVASLTAANSTSPATLTKETPTPTIDTTGAFPSYSLPIPSPSPLPLTLSSGNRRTQGRTRKFRSKVPTNVKRTLRFTDKMHSLSKLLPVEEKLDNITMLEEMFDYVKFLQTQVLALESMPVQASYYGAGSMMVGAAGRGMAKLSRQQVLQVLVNSQDVQRAMYSGGWVLVSNEQVADLWSRVSPPVFSGKDFTI